MTNEVVRPNPGLYEFLKGYIGAKPESGTNACVQQYCLGLERSNLYSWVGIASVTDIASHERLVIFLLKQHYLEEKTNEMQRAELEMLHNFHSLQAGIKDIVALNTHTIIDPKITPEHAAEEIRKDMKGNPYYSESSLVFETTL